jgi:hypothetical protein
VFHDVRRPLIFEKILKRASAFQQFQTSPFNHLQHAKNKFKIVARLHKA